MRTTLAAICLVISGCDPTFEAVGDSCSVTGTPTPDVVQPGDTITLTGGPFTEAYDTRVFIGGLSAEVLAVDRVDCLTCDACRAESANSCAACGTCDACITLCEPCVETVVAVVPLQAPVGLQSISLLNRYGDFVVGTVDILPGESAVDSASSGETGSSRDTMNGDTGARLTDSDTSSVDSARSDRDSGDTGKAIRAETGQMPDSAPDTGR